ncbi:MAG: CAP domain-containing protein [Acidobacteriaceae bacterium]
MGFKKPLLFVIALFLALTFSMQAQNTRQSSYMNEAEQSAAADLLQATNQDRSSQGLQPIRSSRALTNAAWLHAQRMVASGTLSHRLPGEPDLIVRVQQAGLHCSTVAENVAEAPTVGQINNEWMHSASHRANLLDPRVNAVGIAIVERHGELYAVEDFARELPLLTRTQQEKQVVSLLIRDGLRVRPGDELATSYCDGSPSGTRPAPALVVRYSTVDLTQLPPRVKKGIGDGTYRTAVVGACRPANQNGFTAYQIVILLY